MDDLAGTKHYDVLGVARDADAGTIKRAFREKARTHHPDKGGSASVFAAIRAAFETLSDAKRRAAYDLLASEHEYRYIPGVTQRARGGEDAMLDDLQRLGLSLDPSKQLVVLCEVCGRPSNKKCFACGVLFCDFCARKLHWNPERGVGLHYPVVNKPGHLRRSLAEKEMEKKIEEDARARLTADPNYRHDAELAEIRRFKERVAEREKMANPSAAASNGFGTPSRFARVFDKQLSRYYMWAQTARKVYVAVYIPTGYKDKDLRVEVAPDGGFAGGGGFNSSLIRDDDFSISRASGSSASGGIVLVQPEDSPPVIERALAGLIDASAPVETLRSKDGRRCALSFTKARPGEQGTTLFEGDPSFARCARQPYVVSESNDEVVVTFDSLPFWIRKDDVHVDVTDDGVLVRIESAGLENLHRTFWRSDDDDAGDGDRASGDGDGDGDGDGNGDGDGAAKKKKKHEPFILPTTAAWSLAKDETKTRVSKTSSVSTSSAKPKQTSRVDDVSLELVVGKRDPTSQESQFKKSVVQDNRFDKRTWNPDRMLGARLFREDQDDFFLEDDLVALVFFETGEAYVPTKPWDDERPSQGFVARDCSELSENARAVLEQLIAMDEAEDGDFPGDVPGDVPGEA